MMSYSLALLSLLSLSLAVSIPSAVHSGTMHYNYNPDDTEVGPYHWSKVSEVCGMGNQSPIDIITKNEITPPNSHSGRPKIKIHNNPNLDISHTEHNFALSCTRTGKCGHTEFNGKKYEFVGLHFHSPSEHTIDNKHCPLEMHMVHQDKDGEYAVVATMFDHSEKDEENSILEKILDSVEAGDESVTINLTTFLHPHNGYHVYIGSLTTPPCKHDVTWIVSEKHLTLSKLQVERYLKYAHSVEFGNNRPVQAINGRVVHKYGAF